MRRFAHGFASLTMLAAVLLAAGGCSDDSAPRSTLQVVSLNDNEPLSSDVLTEDSGGSRGITEDAVTIRVRNVAQSSALNLTPDGPFGHVTLERYRIDFQSSERIESVTGTLGWPVYSGQEASGSFVVVPALWKTRVPLVGLREGGEILSMARITIYGREATSNHEVVATAWLQVNFANWAE